MRERFARFGLGLGALFTVSILLAPLVVIVATSFTSTELFQFPPKGFSIRWYRKILDHPEFIESFIVSLQLAACTAIVATVLGTSAAIGLFRYDFRGRNMLLSFCLSPLLLPQLVLGIAFLIYFSRIGIMFTFFSLLIAHVVITVPFVVRLVLVSLEGLKRSIEQAAAIAGAGPFTVFFKITLWLIFPGIFSGSAFSFIMSFDNLVVSMFLTGTRYVTLPVRILNYLEYSDDPFLAAVSAIVILKILLLLIVLERTIGFTKAFGHAGAQ